MKVLAVLLVASATLAGCVAVPYDNGHPPHHRGAHADRDRDGVPNRYDRDRDNDGVRNRHDRDRDDDGVPNRRDRRPNNPNRY